MTGRRAGLTDRELDVLELALRGLTHQQIGDRLFLSPQTVKTHFRRMSQHLTDERGRPASGALHCVSLALHRGELVFDVDARRVVRPPGRRPLPPLPAPAAPAPATGRTLQSRRAELGW